MKPTGSYREGIERYVPSASEALILLGLFLFCFPQPFFDGQALFGGNDNVAVAGLSTFVVAIVAWVAGVALRSYLNDMRCWLVIGAALLVLVPWLSLNTFQLGLMTQTVYFAILIFGLNVVTGLTGQISLGHGALVGLSAYTTAILMTHWDWNVYPAMLVGVFVTTVVGFALGVPALRLAGPYLAIATLAAAIIFPLIMKLDAFEEYSGTVQGLKVGAERQPKPPGIINDWLTSDSLVKIPEQRQFLQEQVDDPETPAPVRQRAREQLKREEGVFSQAVWLYYLTVIPAILGLVGYWNLARSRIGRAFVAVRDQDVAATSMGINVALYKVLSFGISAFYAGVTGALLFMVIGFVSPESFDLVNLSINPLAYLVIGGLASTGGSVVAAIGLKWVPEMTGLFAREYTEFDLLQGALVGLLLIVVMTRLPQGIWGACVAANRLPWVRLWARARGWAASQTVASGAAVGTAVLAVLVVGIWLGLFWAVMLSGVLIVAPRDVWSGPTGLVRRLNVRARRRRNESPVPDVT